MIGFGLQSAYNTKGVFGTWDGPSGKGKSDAAKACVRQLPEEYTIISSVTAKSLYHRAKNGFMLPAMVLYLDDKNIEAGSDLEETLKRIQTFFQEGAEHETLDGKGGYVKTKLTAPVAGGSYLREFCGTDGQLKNRSWILELILPKRPIKKFSISSISWEIRTNHRYGNTAYLDMPGTLERHQGASLQGESIPADLLIEISDKSNRRNPSLFLDMVVGLSVHQP